jgi:hypothetical protein
MPEARYSSMPLTVLVPPMVRRSLSKALIACSALLLFHGTPSPFQNSVDILLAGAQKLQEVHILVSARLRNTQKDEVLFNSGGCRRSFNNVPKRGKGLHRMFGVIVVPWHSVIAEESEELLPVFLKALPVLRGHLALPLSREGHL